MSRDIDAQLLSLEKNTVACAFTEKQVNGCLSEMISIIWLNSNGHAPYLEYLGGISLVIKYCLAPSNTKLPGEILSDPAIFYPVILRTKSWDSFARAKFKGQSEVKIAKIGWEVFWCFITLNRRHNCTTVTVLAKVRQGPQKDQKSWDGSRHLSLTFRKNKLEVIRSSRFIVMTSKT